MTDRRHGLEDEAPDRHSRWHRILMWLAVLGGPLAWFAQLNANYGFLGQPCFPGPDRNVAIPDHSAWVWPVSILAYLLCLAIAILAAWAAILVIRKARAGDPQGKDSRDCFIGYAGIILSVGFAILIFSNLLALIVVPACAL